MTGDTGAAVEASEYQPYGMFRSQAGTVVSDYKFTDQELDAESGLYNYDARLYDPMIGRFISADSIVPNPFNPQSLNRYSYVRNNPLIYIDPTGHYDDQDNNSVADGVCSGDVDNAVDGDDGAGRGDPSGLQNAFVSRAWRTLDEMKRAMRAGWAAVVNAPTAGFGIIGDLAEDIISASVGIISMPIRAGFFTGKLAYDVIRGNWASVPDDLKQIRDAIVLANDLTGGPSWGYDSWASSLIEGLVPNRYRKGITRQGIRYYNHDVLYSSGQFYDADLQLANPMNWAYSFQPISMTYQALASIAFGAKLGVANALGIKY